MVAKCPPCGYLDRFPLPSDNPDLLKFVFGSPDYLLSFGHFIQKVHHLKLCNNGRPIPRRTRGAGLCCVKAWSPLCSHVKHESRELPPNHNPLTVTPQLRPSMSNRAHLFAALMVQELSAEVAGRQDDSIKRATRSWLKQSTLDIPTCSSLFVYTSWLLTHHRLQSACLTTGATSICPRRCSRRTSLREDSRSTCLSIS
jgi:hypothetical protein